MTISDRQQSFRSRLQRTLPLSSSESEDIRSPSRSAIGDNIEDRSSFQEENYCSGNQQELTQRMVARKNFRTTREWSLEIERSEEHTLAAYFLRRLQYGRLRMCRGMSADVFTEMQYLRFAANNIKTRYPNEVSRAAPQDVNVFSVIKLIVEFEWRDSPSSHLGLFSKTSSFSPINYLKYMQPFILMSVRKYPAE